MNRKEVGSSQAYMELTEDVLVILDICIGLISFRSILLSPILDVLVPLWQENPKSAVSLVDYTSKLIYNFTFLLQT